MGKRGYSVKLGLYSEGKNDKNAPFSAVWGCTTELTGRFGMPNVLAEPFSIALFSVPENQYVKNEHCEEDTNHNSSVYLKSKIGVLVRTRPSLSLRFGTEVRLTGFLPDFQNPTPRVKKQE